MTRRAVQVGSLLYTVNFDDAAPSAEGWWALAIGRVLDELTGLPVAGTVKVAGQRGILARLGPEGSLALVARPWIACPPLAAPAYTVTVTIAAPGYVTTDVAVTVPSAQRHLTAIAPPGTTTLTLDSVLNLTPGQILDIGPLGNVERLVIRHLGPGPSDVTLDGGVYRLHNIGDPVVADAWTPVDLGDVELRREPAVIRGRTVQRDPLTGTSTAVAFATIAIADVWISFDDLRAQLPGRMTTANPVLRMFPAAIAPGTVASRDVATGQVASSALPPAAPNDERALAAAAPAGAATVRIDHRGGLVPPVTLRLDPERGDASEAVTVTAIAGFAPPDGPGDGALALPLRGAHRAGAQLIPVTPGAPGAAAFLRRDVRPGDRVIFVDTLAALPDHIDVQITGGAPALERQHLRRLETTSDAAGYFTLPPIHRAAAIAFVATAPLLAAVPFTVYPDYEAREQFLDVVFA